MIITNNYNLPHAFVEFANQEYEIAPNEYRVTSMLNGLKETILLRRHKDEIVVDVSDMVWMLFGSAVHHILEKSSTTSSEIKEERLKMSFDEFVLSGQFDLYCKEEKLLTDYKTTSAWKIVKGNYIDWKKQLTVYSILLEKVMNLPVEKAKITAFLKDHSRAELAKNSDYPPIPVHTVFFDIIEQDKEHMMDELKNSFSLLREYDSLSDDEIPECPPAKRWIADWAVMKKDAKRATRVFKEEEFAWAWIEENVKEEDYQIYRVISRGDMKCQHYCYANKFCSYWQENYNA